MNTKLSCRVTPDYFEGVDPLRLTILLDSTPIFDQDITEAVDIVHEFAEDEADHVLEFVMSNKTHEHCKWDGEKPVADCLLNITDVGFDDIMLNQLFIDHSTYYHNFNSPDSTDFNHEERFYGVMGCNGRAVFKFQQPIYLWLLEHM